jgi:lipid II:glycine glycyltransferase (peptidoglycan interpeptide bridge formation enzyme)
MHDRFEPKRFLPLQQSAVYATAVSACGARVRMLETEFGRTLAVERGRFRLVFRGPDFGPDVPQCHRVRLLRSMARWPGLTIATPEEEVTSFGLIPLVTPMHHAVWDLLPDLLPDLRAGMSGKWRNRLVAAERAGVQVCRGDSGTLDRLLAEEGRQRRMRRYRALPEGFTRALPEAALRLWEWRREGAMGAAMAFAVHGSTATYHLGWGSEAARAAGVHAVMLIRAAEALSAEGVRWLDLGPVDSEAAPGLARFKLGTGARLKRLGATCLVLP